MKEYRQDTNPDGKPAISKDRYNLKSMGTLDCCNRSGKEYASVMTHGEGGMKAKSGVKSMGANPMTGGMGKEYRQYTAKG
jgi:hypothetical protein